MIRLPRQADAELQSQFKSFDYCGAIQLAPSKVDANYAVFKSDIPEVNGGIGFWTGMLPDYVSYLALRPITYGEVSAFEAFRSWTDPDHRRKGFASELLGHAAAHLRELISDRDGMSEAAYLAWIAQRSLRIQYVDAQVGTLVAHGDIPSEELFTPWEQGRRWQILLRPFPE